MRSRPTVRKIMIASAEVSEIPFETLYGRRRPRNYVMWRWAAMLVAERYGHSSAAIGRGMHKDHATVLHGMWHGKNSPEIRKKAAEISVHLLRVPTGPELHPTITEAMKREGRKE